MDDRNCPNCGAPITGPACPYCDTRFENVVSMAIGKTVTVSFEHDGLTYEFEMQVDNMRIDADANPSDYYSWDGEYVFSMCYPEYRASFSGRVIGRNGRNILVRLNG